MAFTPSLVAQRIAALAGANLNALAAPVSALASAVAGGLLAPAAYLDAIVATRGYLFQDSGKAQVSYFTSSTTPANVFEPTTFAAPIAGTYEVAVDMDISCTAFSSASNVVFKITNTTTGVTYSNFNSRVTFFALDRRPVHMRLPVIMAAGNNVLQLVWNLESGSGLTAGATAGTNCRTFTISG